jgi:hypothetical protein
MELNCMGMKATGSYTCRTLSYQGAQFELVRVSMAPITRYDVCTHLRTFAHI